MTTLDGLLKLQKQINSAESKVRTLQNKRMDMIQALGLKTPLMFNERRKENFVSIDGSPVRLWVYSNGALEIENLTF